MHFKEHFLGSKMVDRGNRYRLYRDALKEKYIWKQCYSVKPTALTWKGLIEILRMNLSKN